MERHHVVARSQTTTLRLPQQIPNSETCNALGGIEGLESDYCTGKKAQRTLLANKPPHPTTTSRPSCERRYPALPAFEQT